MADEIKYVRVEGRVQIEYQKGVPAIPIDGENPERDEEALVMRFLDEQFDVRTDLEPLYFYLKKENGEPDPVKFRHVHLIAAFNQTGYERVRETLQTIDPIQKDWGDIPPVFFVDPDMNPSGPPKPKM
jgi:hypothetical protein